MGSKGKPERTPTPLKSARTRAVAAKTREADDRASGAASRSAGAPGRETVVAAAREIIAVAGKPLDRNRLLRELKAKGVMVGGKRPLANLQNMLWKSKAAIVNLPGHGHWLADRDYPPADYRAGAAREP